MKKTCFFFLVDSKDLKPADTNYVLQKRGCSSPNSTNDGKCDYDVSGVIDESSKFVFQSQERCSDPSGQFFFRRKKR